MEANACDHEGSAAAEFRSLLPRRLFWLSWSAGGAVIPFSSSTSAGAAVPLLLLVCFTADDDDVAPSNDMPLSSLTINGVDSDAMAEDEAVVEVDIMHTSPGWVVKNLEGLGRQPGVEHPPCLKK